ncbi:LysR family transcriptional regulator [Roseibium marinum]|uniref:DNA-binding transcriptional LysR family regulator n=1 Tax=Roseibium marinum TaxID=281252 RepID=A0A2S3UW63_9HYPH|nr:LysR family transcriptional regulator [Roseibium marinum]POF31793.1 DNA-binding transcriptional LysR family regulator [Roseibium marinum]
MDKIETMRAFVAVAQEHSFTAAGRRLGVSTKLVSKYVQQLEGTLQTQLFNRTTRSVSLTDVGSAYLERCRPILEQLDELESLVRERQGALAGQIRLTAPTGFGSTRLPSALLPFLKRHPDVEVDMKLTDNRIAIVEEGFDLAIRIGSLRDSTLIARKLVDMPLVVCAAPEYLNAHGRPQDPGALATHVCLVDNNQVELNVWRLRAGGREHVIRPSGAVQANSPGALARLAKGGLGITRAPLYAVEAALENGKLERVLPDYETDVFGVYALYPPNRHLTRRVRALIDHLAEEFSR